MDIVAGTHHEEQMPSKITDEWMTMSDAADEIGVSMTTLRRMLERELSNARVYAPTAKRRYILRADVEAFIESRGGRVKGGE